MRKIIAADLQAAEVRIFAHYSGDKKLQAVFPKGEDIYSRVAIDVFDRHDLSANPEDSNFLKAVEPDLRNQSKVFTLSVVYGASGFQVAAGLELFDKNGRPDSRRGQVIIDKYLSTYPNLRRYMIKQELMFKQKGYVVNQFGRVRRFDDAHALYKRYGDQLLNVRWAKAKGLENERKTLKKALNAAKNFPIQSTTSSLVNRAMIEMGQWIERSGEDVLMLLNVHDELVVECDESIIDLVSEKLKYYMEHNKYAKLIDVPLIATPIIGDNLGECK